MDNPINPRPTEQDFHQEFAAACAEFTEPKALNRIDKTRREASRIFNDSIAVRQWMLLKNETLANETPLRLSANSEAGRKRVSELLQRMEHGIF